MDDEEKFQRIKKHMETVQYNLLVIIELGDYERMQSFSHEIFKIANFMSKISGVHLILAIIIIIFDGEGEMICLAWSFFFVISSEIVMWISKKWKKKANCKLDEIAKSLGVFDHA